MSFFLAGTLSGRTPFGRNSRFTGFGGLFGPWALGEFPGAFRNGKTATSRAGRPKSGLPGHFSEVSPPGFNGFYTLLRPHNARSTPYRFGRVLGRHGPERKNGRISGWVARIGIPRALCWGINPWVWGFPHTFQAQKHT